MSAATNAQRSVVPVLGGGPAGMSCALWLFNYGLRPMLIEPEPALGGMARRSPYPNDSLLGQPGKTARQNAEVFAHHLARLPVEPLLGTRALRLQCTDGQF